MDAFFLVGVLTIATLCAVAIMVVASMDPEGSDAQRTV